MPAAVERAPLLLKLAVAVIFLCGVGFGAVASLSQTEPKPQAKPVEVAKVDPKPEPKPEPKTEPTAAKPEPEVKKLTPATKPEPKKVEPPKKPDPKPEPKKPEPPKPEPPKPEPKKPEPSKSSAVTFQQVQKVLRDNCTRCHGDPKIEARIDLRTLDSIKKKKGLLVPGEPSASDLYGSMEAGTMPPPEVKTRPTAAEMKIVKDWIAAGAK
jgi:type IV secretory pathway VirB10-like protein